MVFLARWRRTVPSLRPQFVHQPSQRHGVHQSQLSALLRTRRHTIGHRAGSSCHGAPKPQTGLCAREHRRLRVCTPRRILVMREGYGREQVYAPHREASKVRDGQDVRAGMLYPNQRHALIGGASRPFCCTHYSRAVDDAENAKLEYPCERSGARSHSRAGKGERQSIRVFIRSRNSGGRSSTPRAAVELRASDRGVGIRPEAKKRRTHVHACRILVHACRILARRDSHQAAARSCAPVQRENHRAHGPSDIHGRVAYAALQVGPGSRCSRFAFGMRRD
jgi:hypothetical protein